MFRLPVLAFALALATALPGCLTEPAADAPAPAPAAAAPSYPELATSPIRGLSPKQIEDLRTGAGAGLALPAELNGYPGPKHVLDLADELALTGEQRAHVEALREKMTADAVREGRRVLDAHAALDGAFRDGSIDRVALERLLEDVTSAEAKLRAVHLAAHLATMDVLTHEQVRRYAELRGYGAGGHGGHDGGH